MSTSIFLHLSPQSQRALIAGFYAISAADAAVIPDPAMYRAHHNMTAAERFAEPHFAMLRACVDGIESAVRELLDLGVDANEISWRKDNHIVPLSAVDQGQNGMAITELLLARGANPNHLSANRGGGIHVSPMHDCCDQPQILQKLIDHGGDVGLRAANGFSVLDHWVWMMHGPSKKKQVPGLQALDTLLANGLDVCQSMHDGSSFLTSCWASGFLRRHILSFIEKGFDPRQRGTGKGAAGNSLFEHLEKKVKSGKGGPLAAQIVAGLQAQALDASTPSTFRQSPGPRL